MVRNVMEMMWQRRYASVFVVAAIVMCFGLPSFAQQPVRGTITGTVAADQGKVIGLRVTAHNLDNRLWYTVFTYKGHYTVPQALPGRYELRVYEPSFASPPSRCSWGPAKPRRRTFQLPKSPTRRRQ